MFGLRKTKKKSEKEKKTGREKEKEKKANATERETSPHQARTPLSQIASMEVLLKLLFETSP